MRKIILLIVSIFLINAITYAQEGVSIGATTAHGSAMLDITSTNKGLLIPRMTTLQRRNIGSTAPFAVPTQGLMVFDTDLDCIMTYTLVSGWKALVQSGSPKPIVFRAEGGGSGFTGFDTFLKLPPMAILGVTSYNYGGALSNDGKSIFTAPTAGIYHFEVHLRFTSDFKNTSHYQIRFKKHGSTEPNDYSYGSLVFDGSFHFEEATAIKDYSLNEGDTIEVEYQIGTPSTAPAIFNYNTVQGSTFSGFRIAAF